MNAQALERSSGQNHWHGVPVDEPFRVAFGREDGS